MYTVDICMLPDISLGANFPFIFLLLLCFVLEDAYQRQAVIDGESGLLDILDTAGQVMTKSLGGSYLKQIVS